VLCVIIFSLPTSLAGIPWNSTFSLSAFNYAPLVTVVLVLAVWIGWEAGAKHSFKGPVRTVDDPTIQGAGEALTTAGA
jgi:hypothetical protein